MNPTPLSRQHCQQYQIGSSLTANQLLLPAPHKHIEIKDVIRFLPGKRLVLKGRWLGEDVAVKLFFSARHSQQHWQREINGLTTLQQQQLPCPTIKFQGMLANDDKCYVVVTEWINAPRFQEVWQQTSTPSAQLRLLQQFINTIATLFAAKLDYLDCHFNNFLYHLQQLVLLDGDAVKVTTKNLDPISVYATCLAQIPFVPQHDIATLLKPYIPNLAQHIQPLMQKIELIRQQRCAAYLKKSLRDCTAFRRIHTRRYTAMIDRQYDIPALTDWLENPDAVFSHGQMLKNGNSSTVIKTSIGNHHVVIKRYNIKNVWHFLRRLGRQTRARTAWLNALRLQCFAIPSLKPIAFVEQSRFGLTGQSYFIYAYQDGERADQFFQQDHHDEQTKQNIIQQFANLFQQFKHTRISHGDLKASNFLITPQQQVVLLDLDALAQYPNSRHFHAAHTRDNQRFMQNWCHDAALLQQFKQALTLAEKAQ